MYGRPRDNASQHVEHVAPCSMCQPDLNMSTGTVACCRPHSWTIRYCPAPGASGFTFRLPCRYHSRGEGNYDHSNACAEYPCMTAKPSRVTVTRILLAEDDESMRGFLVRALEKAGHDVIAFANGEEGYERLKTEPFTLLLTDIVMPKMDGIELARRASELDPDLKIMFITGFAAVALNPDNQAPKDAKILSKPFHLRDLVDEVERLLAA